MNQKSRQVAERLLQQLGVASGEIYQDGRGVVVRLKDKAKLQPALSFLKQDRQCPFELLAHLSAIDWLFWKERTGQQKAKRFTLFYNLYSLSQRARLFLEVDIEENESVASASAIYASANWAEREVYDLFGINFEGHPQLRRIFLPEDFRGHPLRKDFPCQGRPAQDWPQE